jgi:hypothetical protein
MPRPDTSQDHYIASNYYQKTAQEIADSLGWTKSKVLRRVSALKLPPKEKMTPDYTVEELVFIAQNKNVLPLEEIANHLGRPIEGVRKKSNRMGLTERKDLYTEEEDQVIMAIFHTSPYNHIAALLGRTQEAIRARAKYLKITGNKGGVNDEPDE